MQPEITVLMSCYNAEKWLAEAIDSVLAQTYKDFELILIDDGSKDRTLDLLRHYEKLDTRIKVIAKVNTGLPDSLNVGIFQARGQWIARLDADDICEPSRLEEQLNFVSKNPQVVLLGTGFLEIDANGRLIKDHQYPPTHAKLESALQRAQRFFSHSSAFYHTATVQKLGGYRPRIRLAEDRDLWLRLSEQGQLSCLERPLVRIRRHIDQISYQDSARNSIIDAMCATVSYFLRAAKCKDPVDTENEHDWQQFRDWVETAMEEEGVFSHRRNWLAARNHFVDRQNKLVATFFFAKELVDTNYIINTIKRKTIDLNMPKYLARKWNREFSEERSNE